MQLRSAYTAEEMKDFKTKWKVQIPLKLRAFLATPGCFVDDDDEGDEDDEDEDEDEEDEEDEDFLLRPEYFETQPWDLRFNLTREDLKRWLWLQGLDVNRADEQLQEIKSFWEHKSREVKCPPPHWQLTEQFVYYNMIHDAIYTGVEMEEHCKYHSSVVDWIQSLE